MGNGWRLDRPVARRRLVDRALSWFGVVGDLFAVNAAMVFAYWLRFRSGWIPVTKGEPLTRDAYFGAMVAVSMVWLVVFAWLDMYRASRWRRVLDEGYRVLIASAIVLVIVMAMSFLYRSFEYSRLTAGIAAVVAVALAIALRAVGMKVARALRELPGSRRRVALLGVPELADRLASGDREVCYTCAEASAGLEEVRRRLSAGAVDEVVLARADLPADALLAFLRDCEAAGAEAVIVPHAVDILLTRGSREELGGLSLVRVRDVPLDGAQRLLKRAFDILVAAVLLVLLSPLMLVIAVAVRCTSPGPALFSQDRVTEGGRVFRILKFRSMVQDAEAQTGPVWARRGDPRTTPLGKFLRRTSLDELPQLWNVLVGDMSLIGPRPERPEFVAQFAERVPRYQDRHRMKAGITGWAQVNGERGGQSCIEERTRYDLYYVDHWSLMLDLEILVKTAFEVLFHRGAG